MIQLAPRHCRVLGAAALMGTLAVVAGHLIALGADNLDAVTSPISALSRGTSGGWHSAGLLGFALAQIAVSVALRDWDAGWLWRLSGVLTALAGAGVMYVAWYFEAASVEQLYGHRANDPLSIVACLVGVAMGARQLGWVRRSRRMAWINATCLAVWLALVPTIVLVTDAWLGAYERLVGVTYVIWVAAHAMAAIRQPR
ncbi:MAG: hypothetical protein AAF610_03585 [Pseudomonadota bacterium]